MSGGSLVDAERADRGGRPDPAQPGFDAVLDELLAVRGATVAAVADGGGVVLASRAADEATLRRTTDVVTSALAAATALTGLLEDGAGGAGAGGQATAPVPKQVMLNLDDGALLLVPLTTSDHVIVLGLASEADIGRARFALKSILAGSAGRLGGGGRV